MHHNVFTIFCFCIHQRPQYCCCDVLVCLHYALKQAHDCSLFELITVPYMFVYFLIALCLHYVELLLPLTGGSVDGRSNMLLFGCYFVSTLSWVSQRNYTDPP